MPLFGVYETVGEPVAITEERGRVSTVWKAQKTGVGDAREYAVKCVAPRQLKGNEAQAGGASGRDMVKVFLEGIEQLAAIQSGDGGCLAPIHASGRSAEGAWYVTDFYPRSLKTWITLRGRVDGAALQHVVRGIVTGCLALKQSRGYSHGNLKTSNLFLAGKPQALRTTPIQLADAGSAELFPLPSQEGRQPQTADKRSPEAMELHDLQSLGELIMQLVEGRLISSSNDYNYPIPRSSAWDNLGRDGERWREICNQLLDPRLTLDAVNLEKLRAQIEPKAKSSPWPPYAPAVAAAAGIMVLLVASIYLVARQRVPTIARQPQNKISEVRSNLSLTVVAKGGALRYQWWRDGHPYSGKTNASLKFSSVQTNDSGRYFVVVANRAGAVTSAVAQLTVATTILTVTAEDAKRVYGESNPPLTGTTRGVRPGDGITANFDSAANGDSAVGRYDIIPRFNDPGGKLHNYTVITNRGTLTIMPANLTVAATDNRRVYGESNPSFTGNLRGVRLGDDITATFVTLARGDSAIGNYDIIPVFNDSGGKLHNYTVITNKGTLTVMPANLTVAVAGKQRIYGENNPLLTGDLRGVRLGDDITATFETPARGYSAVGSYDILPVFNDPGGKLRNYIVITNKGTFVIAPARLTVTAHDEKRVYGDNNPPLTGEVSGARSGDNISVTYSTSADIHSAAGSYDILQSLNYSGGKLHNYTVITNRGTLTITPARLTVTAKNEQRVYGENNPPLTGDLSGVRPGDEITNIFSTPALADSAVGTYDIVPVFKDVDGRLVNYTVATNKGALTITPARLTAKAHDAERVYGENNPTLTGELGGVRPGDDLTANFETTARSDSSVGSYDILPMFNDPGAKLRNYIVVTNRGTLTITPARMTVTVHHETRVYGAANPPLTGVVGGLRTGDDVTAAYYTIARGDSEVGSYDILPVFNDPVGKLRNYTVVTNLGTLKITRNRLTVTADDKRRVYGERNPRLTGEFTGVRPGDHIAVNFVTPAQSDAAIGTHDIVPVFKDPDGRLQNYIVITNKGELKITPARLTVAATDKKRVYGDRNPALTGDLRGVRPSDDIAATYRTAADSNSPVGPYAIQPVLSDPQGKLSNYTVIASKGTLTITPARLVVKTHGIQRSYGVSNPALTGEVIGLRSGDNVSLTCRTSADLNSPAGSYDIVPIINDPDAKLRNYNVVTNLGRLKIIAYAASAEKPPGKPPWLNVLGISNFDFIWIAGLENGKGGYVEKTELSQTQFRNLASKLGLMLQDTNRLPISSAMSDEPVNVAYEAAIRLRDVLNQSSSAEKPPGQFQLPSLQDFLVMTETTSSTAQPKSKFAAFLSRFSDSGASSEEPTPVGMGSGDANNLGRFIVPGKAWEWFNDQSAASLTNVSASGSHFADSQQARGLYTGVRFLIEGNGR
jgi:hypothetical protein